MRVAVTGAGGFIGRYVLEELSRWPVEVTAMSRQPQDFPHASPFLLDLDLVDAGSWDAMGRPDVLIHLAWDGLPNYRSLHHFETELPRQYRFIKQLVNSGLPRVVVAGTCFEYGMQSGELNEDMPALPGNPYGYAKAALRAQLEFLRAEQAFELLWTRLFYLWGEGQSEKSLYSQLATAAMRGDQRFPMSGGDQLRDYMHVSEMANLLVNLALRPVTGLVNVSSGVPVSIRSLVEKWIAQHGWVIKPELGVYPYPEHEPMNFWGNTDKLESMLRIKSLIEN